MKSTFTKTLAAALLLLATATATLAQKPHEGPRNASHPARTEVKAYIQQNVLPVVQQQRQKLETQLANTDKAQLATYRTQLKDVRQRSQALRRGFRASQSTASALPALTDEQRQQLRQLHTESRAIMQNVAQLAQKYASNISQLTQEIQPQKEKWTAELQAITAKNTSPEQQEKLGRLRNRLPHRGGASRFFQPTAFLLMNPGAPVAAEPGVSATSLYPNPAVATSQLEYTVTKAGPVTVELLDGRGNTLRTITQESKQEKGPHALPINLSDLAAGTYYYKITTRTGSETKRFVKE